MTVIRGLRVIRGGGARPTLSAPARAAGGDSDGGDGDGGDNGDAMPTMAVEFSRFDTWYEIDSFWEGRYLERTVRGAFKKTIAESGGRVKVLFNHGRSAVLGTMALGVPTVLEERWDSPYMEVPLLAGVPELLVEGLRAGAYGSSFMFEVLQENWNYEPGISDHNPQGYPERSLVEVKLFEAGPVTWPANPDATAGLLRSGADWLMGDMYDDEGREELVRSFAAFRALHGLRTSTQAATPASGPGSPTPTPGDPPGRHADGTTAAARRRRELDLFATRR